MSDDPHALKLYTDGNCYKNPGGAGAIACVAKFPESWNRDDEMIFSEGFYETSNNRMELQACIRAYEHAAAKGSALGVQRVLIVTDSLYIANNCKRITIWRANKWCNPSGRPLENSDLWKRFLSVQARVKIRTDIVWKKGKNSPILKMVDRAAKAAGRSPKNFDRGFRGGKVARSKVYPNDFVPPLNSRSRGRGLGVLRYWEGNEIILSQAIAVCDLLDRNGRTKWVPLGLWLAGFEVNLGTARTLWLESLARTRKDLLGTALSKEECEDALGDLCSRLAKGLSDQSWVRNADLHWTRLEPLLFEVLNAFFNPYPDVEIAIDEQLADSARTLMCGSRANRQRPEFLSEPELEEWLDSIHKTFSICAMHEIIAVATDDDLKITHNRWRSAVALFKLLSTNASGGMLSDDLCQLGRRAAFQFGGLCIFGLLLNRNGKAQLLDSCIEEARTTVLSQFAGNPPLGGD